MGDILLFYFNVLSITGYIAVFSQRHTYFRVIWFIIRWRALYFNSMQWRFFIVPAHTTVLDLCLQGLIRKKKYFYIHVPSLWQKKKDHVTCSIVFIFKHSLSFATKKEPTSFKERILNNYKIFLKKYL